MTVLCHYGVKGMKWGVRKKRSSSSKRRTSHKSDKDNYVDNLIKSGKIGVDILESKQLKHILISNDGENDGTNSYLYGTIERAKELVDNLHGTGSIIVDKNGNWNHKERVKSSKYIGYYRNKNNPKLNGMTKNGIIHYRKKYAHIVPARPDKKKDQKK